LLMIHNTNLIEGFMTSLFSINRYYGITQNPSTKDFVIIMKYYKYDLKHYISENFNSIKWNQKLGILQQVIYALDIIHHQGIIHRDFHSGNILCKNEYDIVINDLGISKLSTESLNNDNKYYGIIPYIAPEIFQGQKYKKYSEASDIYSFSMIMWELMVGRRPFWDRDYNTSLIIDICDNIRPPIVTNAPEGYIKLMQECWQSDPKLRPTAEVIFSIIDKIILNEEKSATIVIKSPDVGPIITSNNESKLINYDKSKRSLQSRSISGESIYDSNYSGNVNDINTKKFKFNESYNNESDKNKYISNALEFDISESLY
ncbi:1907_t:CDS:2, partial [Funneliformis geosporum]